ncbi:hypothetical protein [Listeria ivanovii]|uniref:hypothetical protein n=1 Tax=Listeria ivanovii TaxID=1638 RepID=UPI0021AC13F8|nr:hypothetical protein [Listeria ivanovii]
MKVIQKIPLISVLRSLLKNGIIQSRTSKKRIKKYEEKNLLKYIPGKGRGNLSTILFSNDFHSEVHNVLTNCIKNNDIKFALQLSQLSIPQEWFAPFLEEVYSLFNSNSENGNNIIRFIINRKITTLNPNTASLQFEASLIKQISNTLVDYSEDKDKFISSVAIDWSHNEDFTKWIFNIRKNIFFITKKK